jgi:hypothetical protein
VLFFILFCVVGFLCFGSILFYLFCVCALCYGTVRYRQHLHRDAEKILRNSSSSSSSSSGLGVVKSEQGASSNSSSSGSRVKIEGNRDHSSNSNSKNGSESARNDDGGRDRDHRHQQQQQQQRQQRQEMDLEDRISRAVTAGYFMHSAQRCINGVFKYCPLLGHEKVRRGGDADGVLMLHIHPTSTLVAAGEGGEVGECYFDHVVFQTFMRSTKLFIKQVSKADYRYLKTLQERWRYVNPLVLCGRTAIGIEDNSSQPTTTSSSSSVATGSDKGAVKATGVKRPLSPTARNSAAGGAGEKVAKSADAGAGAAAVEQKNEEEEEEQSKEDTGPTLQQIQLKQQQDAAKAAALQRYLARKK